MVAHGGKIKLEEGTGGGTMVGFKAPDTEVTDECIWTLPSADGTAGQALVTDGNKTLSFAPLGLHVATLELTAEQLVGNAVVELIAAPGNGKYILLDRVEGLVATGVNPYPIYSAALYLYTGNEIVLQIYTLLTNVNGFRSIYSPQFFWEFPVVVNTPITVKSVTPSAIQLGDNIAASNYAPSLAFDNTGVVHVALALTDGPGNVQVWKWWESAWVQMEGDIVDVYYSNCAPSLAFDNAGVVHVALTDASGSVQVWKWESAWVQVGSNISNSGCSPFLGFNSAGTPYVAISASTGVQLWVLDTGAWTKLGGDLFTSTYQPSLAFDNTDVPHIAFTNTNTITQVVKLDNNSWVFLDEVPGTEPSLGFNSSGVPHVTTKDLNNAVKMWVLGDSGWIQLGTNIANSNNYFPSPLIFDSSGEIPHVAVSTNDGNNGVQVWQWASNAWVLLASGGYSYAAQPAFDLDSSGTPYFAFIESQSRVQVWQKFSGFDTTATLKAYYEIIEV